MPRLLPFRLHGPARSVDLCRGCMCDVAVCKSSHGLKEGVCFVVQAGLEIAARIAEGL